MREIVLDSETTGLNFLAGDRIIEIACVELINHVPSGNNLQFYCSTDKKIGEDELKNLEKQIQNLTDKQISELERKLAEKEKEIMTV